jgi:hypothetical protein
MAQDTIETRLARLEEQVSLLMRNRRGEYQPAANAWRKTVGMFRGDPVFGEMIAETERRHAEERRLAQDATESDAK